MNPTPSVPEISSEELIHRVESGEPIRVLDLRANTSSGRIDILPADRYANIKGSELVALGKRIPERLPVDGPVAVVCERGNSSKQIAHRAALGAHGDRQALHEVIRQNALATAEAVGRGEPNRLLERLAADATFAKIPTGRLQAELDPQRYTGRSTEQVSEFLVEYLAPLLGRAAPLAVAAASVDIRV